MIFRRKLFSNCHTKTFQTSYIVPLDRKDPSLINSSPDLRFRFPRCSPNIPITSSHTNFGVPCRFSVYFPSLQMTIDLAICTRQPHQPYLLTSLCQRAGGSYKPVISPKVQRTELQTSADFGLKPYYLFW